MTEEKRRKNEMSETKNEHNPQEGKAAEGTKATKEQNKWRSFKKEYKRRRQLVNPYLTRIGKVLPSDPDRKMTMKNWSQK